RASRAPPSETREPSAHEIALGEVLHRLAGLRERARDTPRRVDPEDPQRLAAAVAERVLAAGGDVRGVEKAERRDDAVDLDLSLALEDRHLLVAVVEVQRRARARRVDARPA